MCVCGALFTRGRRTNFPPLYSLHTKLWRQRKIGLTAQHRKSKAISHGRTLGERSKRDRIPVAWQGVEAAGMTLQQQEEEEEEEGKGG